MKLGKLPNRLKTIDTNRRPLLEAKAGTTERIRGGAWMATRQRIMLRDSFTCAGCGLIRNDHEVDHVVPLEQQGSNADDNLQLLCRKHGNSEHEQGCHSAKSTLETRNRFKRY
jgi:5-methylcytosine-specific restriction endonuclease McrA